MKTLLLCIFFSIQINALTESSAKLYFSENPLLFTPPIIIKNKISYFPIRTIIHYFDGTIKKSNKTYIYNIKIDNHHFKIKENNKKYTHNNIKKTFSSPPFIYKTRLYVPLYAFLNNINFNITYKSPNYYAHQSSKEIKNTSLNTHPIPFIYNKNNALNAKYIYLPIAKKTLKFRRIRKNGTSYVDMSEFLTHLGYSLKQIDNHMLMKKGAIIYSFKTGSNAVTIQNKQQTTHVSIDYKPFFKNNRFYAQLQPILNDMGFDYIIQNNNIVILKKINHIKKEKHNQFILSKNSHISLTKPYTLTAPPRVYWDLTYTKCPNAPITLNSQTIKHISFGQKKTTCRMVFELNKPLNVSINNKKNTLSTLTFTLPTPQTPVKSPPKKVAIQQKKTPSHSRSLSSLKGKVIIIDPGHGGSDPGAVTKNKDYEKYYTLDISHRIKKRLNAMGATAIMLRSKDTNPSLYQRVKKINKINGDFLISVHVNSFINAQANGTETYYYKSNEKNAAKYIQKELVNTLKLKNNGTKKAQMYILKHSKTPGVLIEPCFITNSKEYRLIKTSAFREKIAKATIAGVVTYFQHK
jgi:N-acetylmuramoyl-L-alanine amidase CwlD